MDNLETELQMLNHIKQLLGDMILKQKQIDRMSTDINQVTRPRGRPTLHHSTQDSLTIILCLLYVV